MDGVIIVNKPWGKTSHDMVNFIRRTTGIKKVGHTGTLDPAATGVLPICIGNATKACEYLTAEDKGYKAQVVLGMTTDTLDAEGDVLTEQPIADLTEEIIINTINLFIGEIEQIPPMFSAIKKDGKKLYELAREGISIDREKRKVKISQIDILSIDLENGIIEIDVKCSKGTYIRTLCEDIGIKLGCGAYMNKLERTKSGDFTIDESYTADEIKQLADEGRLCDIMIKTKDLFLHIPVLRLNERKSQLVKYGVNIKYEGLIENQEYRLFSPDGEFLSISEFQKGELVLKKAFWNR